MALLGSRKHVPHYRMIGKANGPKLSYYWELFQWIADAGINWVLSKSD